MSEQYDIAIIGSGPGGYVAAVRAAQLQQKVVVIEKANPGGVCLNWGCIPTKALIKNADMWHQLQSAERMGFSVENAGFDYAKIQQRSREVAGRLSKGVGFLFKKNNIPLIQGFARITGTNEITVENNKETQTVIAKNIIIATGARPRAIPGIAIDGHKVISSYEALALTDVPESIVILGAGAIGVEFAYIFRSFGAEVTLVEMMDQILPIEDAEIVKELTRNFKKQKIKMHTSTRVTGVETFGDGVVVKIEKNGESSEIQTQMALVSIGITPNTEKIGLETLGIETDRGYIIVDDHYQTKVENIYAIGDVIGAPALAHVASEEGVHVVEHIAGQNPHLLDYSAVPGCTYCHPQVASVGMTEQAALDENLNIRVGRCHFRANGKSVAVNEIDGLVKVIFDADTDELIGGHVLGAEATELLTELTLAVSKKLTLKDLKQSIHAHPTMSEALKEALLNAYDEAIHV